MKAIEWVSKIWRFFSKEILKNSFVQCGLNSSDPRLYHNLLRHFVQNRTWIEDVKEAEEQTYDFRAFEREAAES